MHIQENILLTPYNTFGLPAKARFFLSIDKVEDYHSDLLTAYESTMILGGGSNVLLTDDYSGLVMQVNIKGKEIITEEEESVLVKIGAGENWHELVLWTLEQGWSGIENLSLIPGTVGAAPIQNIGAYGVELSDVLDRVEGRYLADASPFVLEKKDCRLGYRNSIFKNEWKGKVLITHVYLRLAKQFEANTAYGAIQEILKARDIAQPTAKDVSDAVITIRQSKLPDPKELGNAGSFFKNPILPTAQFESLQQKFPKVPHYLAGEGLVKVPAGWLIEKAGWKGKRVGETGSHARQALVLVNYGQATGQEIFKLSEDILVSVEKQFGVLLEREVTVVG